MDARSWDSSAVALAGALEAGEAAAALLRMSTLSEEGVMAVKQTACDRLLSSRVEMKMKVGLQLPRRSPDAPGAHLLSDSRRQCGSQSGVWPKATMLCRVLSGMGSV